MSDDKDLSILFDGIDPDETEEIVPKGFEVKDLSSANWCMAKIGLANSRIAEREQVAKELHDRIDTWLEKATLDYHKTIDVMKEFLEPYIKQQCDEESTEKKKKRSVKLVLGVAGFRATSGRTNIVDMEKAVEWAKKQGLEIKVVESVSATAIKESIKANGEIPPEDAVIIEVGEDRFYVKVDTE